MKKTSSTNFNESGPRCHDFPRDPTVVLVNTSSISPSSLEVAMLMPRGTLLFHPTKMSWMACGSRLSRKTVGCSSMIAKAKQHQSGFLEAANHFPCQPQKASPFKTIGSTMSRCSGLGRLLWLKISCACSAACGHNVPARLPDATHISSHASVSQHSLEPDSLRLDRKRQMEC